MKTLFSQNWLWWRTQTREELMPCVLPSVKIVKESEKKACLIQMSDSIS
ncbi:hypothetical protein [Hugenholtzia roseola]|nr:hypothetical protein [Hugenholtzia roseola]